MTWYTRFLTVMIAIELTNLYSKIVFETISDHLNK